MLSDLSSIILLIGVCLMKSSPLILAFVSTFLLSLSQITLKLSIERQSSLLDYKSLNILYLITTFILVMIGFTLWFYTISNSALSRVYWITACSYLLVPICSYFILKIHSGIYAKRLYSDHSPCGWILEHPINRVRRHWRVCVQEL